MNFKKGDLVRNIYINNSYTWNPEFLEVYSGEWNKSTIELLRGDLAVVLQSGGRVKSRNVSLVYFYRAKDSTWVADSWLQHVQIDEI